MNRPPVSFVEKVIGLVESKCSASITAGGFEYLDGLYAQYSDHGQDDSWLLDHLRRQFCYVSNPPTWIEREPAWPFCEGRPMLFIGQHSIGVEHHEYAGSGYTVYLFVGRKERDAGFELEFREVVQSEAVAEAVEALNT